MLCDVTFSYIYTSHVCDLISELPWWTLLDSLLSKITTQINIVIDCLKNCLSDTGNLSVWYDLLSDQCVWLNHKKHTSLWEKLSAKPWIFIPICYLISLSSLKHKLRRMLIRVFNFDCKQSFWLLTYFVIEHYLRL